MKKNYFLGAAAAFGLLAFSSCSNDDDPILDQGEVAAGEQVIVLDMQNTDVLSTKSRPLFSTENKGSKEVTDVILYIFQEQDDKTQKVVRTIHVPNWNNTADPYKYGHQKTIKLKGTEGDFAKLEEGTYTIYAVGQNENVVEGNPAPFKFQGEKEAPTDDAWKDVPGLHIADVSPKHITHNFTTTPGTGFPYFFTKPVSYVDATTAFRSRAVGEVFSGQSQPVTFESKEGFSTTVLLKRQVAGVLGYFTNIPAEGKDMNAQFPSEAKNFWSTKLRLVASDCNDRLDMTIKLDDQKDDATEVGKEAIITGFKSEAPRLHKVTFGTTSAYTVYEINLKDWFKWDDAQGWAETFTEEEGNKYLGKTSAWKNYFEGVNANVTVADGSVLGAEFVIPFKQIEAQNTFELQLLGVEKNKDGSIGTEEKILQKWSVKLDKASVSDNDTELNYSIYRNHLYQIGKRGSGDNPTDPGTDPDKPQPLDNTQELVIKINDNWDVIHDMEIE